MAIQEHINKTHSQNRRNLTSTMEDSIKLQTKSTGSENSVNARSWNVALRKCRITDLKKLCFNVFMNFLQALYKRIHYNCFFRRTHFKKALSGTWRSWNNSLDFYDAYSILLRKSMYWFLYDNGLRLERVKSSPKKAIKSFFRIRWNRPVEQT